MANRDSNINPNPNPLPEASGKYFADINAKIRKADKNARKAAEVKLVNKDDKNSIDALRQLIDAHLIQINVVKERFGINSIPVQSYMKQINAAETEINQLLTKNNFENKYVEFRNKKRIDRQAQAAREAQEAREAREAQELQLDIANSDANSEPSSLNVPSAEETARANKEAAAILAASDKLIEELDEEETRTAQAAAQAQKNAIADANKLAKVLVDSLMSAAQMPIAPPTQAEEAKSEVDVPAPFADERQPAQPMTVEADTQAPVAVTANPQLAPIVEPTNETADAIANSIVNAFTAVKFAPPLDVEDNKLAPFKVTSKPQPSEPTPIAETANKADVTIADTIVNALSAV